MRAELRSYAKSQGGYTLVELIVASAIGLFVMTALTSVVLTTWRAGSIATSRIEASGQIRSFQFYANDDFALSGVPTISGCATAAPPPCTISLSGIQVSNSAAPVPSSFQVTYTWDGTHLDRQVGGTAKHVATNVSGISAYVASSALHPTVVVTLTITVQSYVETQTLRFYPRVNP